MGEERFEDQHFPFELLSECRSEIALDLVETAFPKPAIEIDALPKAVEVLRTLYRTDPDDFSSLTPYERMIANTQIQHVIITYLKGRNIASYQEYRDYLLSFKTGTYRQNLYRFANITPYEKVFNIGFSHLLDSLKNNEEHLLTEEHKKLLSDVDQAENRSLYRLGLRRLPLLPPIESKAERPKSLEELSANFRNWFESQSETIKAIKPVSELKGVIYVKNHFNGVLSYPLPNGKQIQLTKSDSGDFLRELTDYFYGPACSYSIIDVKHLIREITDFTKSLFSVLIAGGALIFAIYVVFLLLQLAGAIGGPGLRH